MKHLVESVTDFNGRIIYGCDNNWKPHDQDFAYKKKDGSYIQRGAVAVILSDSGEIMQTKLCKNKLEANDYILQNTESNGIIA